ncbi:MULTISPECIES: DUF58 domain-containing protein [unclassified Massilia]|uniref:DUF58 domain-containing protein n=1 Tax=unclassified Massilia TaxID=2609279 RepID=UPI00068A661C|nr:MULTISPECIES: DUF58 domain-containing protein [unclassified Massilia]ALK99312.2 hypothetical protein AM586_02565 [Massilia sp. WG5]
MAVFASAALAAHTGKLELAIRHVLAGLGHGIHAGRERGAGVEFSEYRAYAPGDEWRRVDWKLMARADRYYVREAERDSHVAVWLVLDATASMGEPSRSISGLDKLGYARLLLGCVGAIAQRQGDAFGLVVCHGERAHFTPASRGPRQLQRVLSQLERVEAAGTLPGSEVLRASLHFARAPSVVCVAGDFLEWPSPLSEAMIRLRGMRHDVRALCLQTEAEIAADFDAAQAWRDPEGDGKLFRFGREARSEYARKRGEHFEMLARQCRAHDIPYTAAPIERAPGEVLRSWLQTRLNARGGR